MSMKLYCCGEEMEFDPGTWEKEGIIEYDCKKCGRTIGVKMCTCNDCNSNKSCEFAYDDYNYDGSCLALK